MGAKVTYVQTIRSVLQNEGFFYLYKGALSAGMGSIVYRATGFSVYDLFYTKWADNPNMRKKIPLTGGVEYRIVCAGFLSGSFRAFLECPFEYAKVRR